MKKIVCVLLVLLMLCGCEGQDDNLQRAMELRAQMLSKPVSFEVEITADYGDQSYTFSMGCQVDQEGELTFSVLKPDTLAGISGTIGAVGGKLTFDDVALAFETMAEGRLSPISGPWVLMKALRSGYITSCCVEEELLRISVDDSYEEDALHLEVWVDGENKPVQAEIYWDGRRLLTLTVTNFEIL